MLTSFSRGSFRKTAVAALCLALLGACGQKSPQDLIDSAQAHLLKDDTATAIVELKAALQQGPQSSKARVLLGEALLKSGQPAPALVELEKAVDLKHPNDEVLPQIATALMAMGQAKKVTDLYAQVQLKDPKAAARLKATVAAAYGAQGLLELCATAVEQALALDPKNDVARVLQARLAAGRGDLDRALSIVDSVLQDFPQQREGLFLKAEILWVGKGDAQGGTAAYRKTLEVAPKYVPAYTALASVALQKHDLPAFKKLVEELKQVLPKHPETRFSEAQLALLSNNIKDARGITQQLLQVAPDNYRVLQLAGAVELNAGSLATAEAHLNKALRVEPRLEVARRLLAQTYLRGGQAAQALAALQPLTEKGAATSETLSTLAEAYLQNGQLAEAEKTFGLAAQQSPNDLRFKTALALTQIAKGHTSDGFAELESLAARDASAYADMALISARLRQNDLDAALKALDGLQAKQPKSPLVFQLRGQVLARQKQIDAARASYEKALEIDAIYFPAVLGLSALDIAEKKYDAAIKRFEHQLAREPKNYRALMELARLRQHTGAPVTSTKTLLAEAVKANVSEPAPRMLLVEYLLSQKDFPGALAAAQDAVAAIPSSIPLLDLLGRAQMAAGDLQQALSSFGKVVAAQPASVLAHLRLAEVYAAKKDFSAAAASLQKALQIDPRSLPAQRGLIQMAMVNKRVNDALAIARGVQRQRPEEAAGFYLEGEIQASQRQTQAALSAFRTALEREPATLTAIRVHALLMTGKQGAEAERFADNWLREHPKDLAFLTHLAAVALDEKQFGLAEQRYRAVIELQPENATALNNVAWSLLQQRKPGAAPFAEKAVALAAEQPAFMDTYAAALAAENKLPQAVEWQRKAVAKAPVKSAPAYRLRLAKLLQQSGDAKAARAELFALKALGSQFKDQQEVDALLKGTNP